MTPTEPNRDAGVADDRYGDLPYDDLFGADGELAATVSIDDVIADLGTVNPG